MIQKLRELITGVSAEKTTEVEVIEACLVAGQQANPGDRLTLPSRDAAALIVAGRAKEIPAPAVIAERVRLESIIPRPWEARPLPEHMKDLPKAFHDYWNLTEKFRCLYGRAAEIETCILRGFGLTADELRMFHAEVSSTTPEKPRSQEIAGWLHQRRPQLSVRVEAGDDDPKAVERRKLADALNRQHEAIRDLTRSHRDDLVRLKFACSDLTLEENARARSVARQLEAVAFDIFKTRIAALGLCESENRRLFLGTAEHQKYVNTIHRPQGVKIAWHDGQTGELREYLDGDCGSLAHHFRTYRAEADKLDALLIQAKAELKRTIKAAA